MSFTSQEFRNALGRYASGVTIVTTADPQGRPVGMTASSFGSVSLDPPLVLFCLGRDADRFGDFTACEHFAINILGDDHAHLSERFAQVGTDNWQDLDYETWTLGCPILTQAIAVLECSKAQVHEAGDHLIIVGHVVALAVADRESGPLIHHRGAYRRLAP
ncbi:MAG: flavin reductase family protein [Alphaproteobacteria bacterium]|nr:flavin reductase family protein [Alphaproteobacteria bacterium]